MQTSLGKDQANPHLPSLRISPETSVRPGDQGIHPPIAGTLRLYVVSEDEGKRCLQRHSAIYCKGHQREI